MGLEQPSGRTGRRRSPLLLVVALLAALALSACGSHQRDASPGSGTHTKAASTKVPTCQRSAERRCYTYRLVLPSYCEVQAVRAFVASGKLRPEDLPDWADRTVRDGTPLIVDFSQDKDDVSLDRRLDQLGLVLDRHSLSVPHTTISACIRTTTRADMARTQGVAPL